MTTSTPPTRPTPLVIEVAEGAGPSAATAGAGQPSRRGLRILAAAVTSMLLAAAAAVLLAIAIGPRLGLFQVETVLSGSMRPRFSPGDLLVVVPERVSDVRAGQVISYHIPTGDHRVETHRIVRVAEPGPHPVVITKGDANAAADPWRARLHGRTAWRLVAVVPHLGSVIRTLRQPSFHVVAVLLIPLLLAAGALRSIWRPATAGDGTP